MPPKQRKPRNKPPAKVPLKVPPRKPLVVPAIVIKSIAVIFYDAMGDFLEDTANRNPDSRWSITQRNDYRECLRSMRLVNKHWASASKQVWDRRVIISSVASMKSYLNNNQHKGCALEFWYVHDTDDEYNKQPHTKNHWHLLAETLSFMPNLRYLVVDVRDSPEDALDDEALESRSKQATGTDQSLDLEESQENIEEDRSRGRAVGVEFSGIRSALRAIGKLTQLRGLQLLADFSSLQDDYRAQRYCPYFINICEQLPNLSQLSYLRIRGFSSHCGQDGDAQLTQEYLDGKSPPQSLETLVLELPWKNISYGAVSWLLLPQQTYAIENLLVKFPEGTGFQALNSLGNLGGEIKCSSTSQMRNLRIEFPDKELDSVPDFAAGSFKSHIATVFLQDSPILHSLHVPPLFVPDKIPDTVEELAIIFEYKEPNRFKQVDDEPDLLTKWESNDQNLLRTLSRTDFSSNLDYVKIAVTNDGGSEGAPCTDGMEDWLPQSAQFCDENDILATLYEEMLLEGRMCAFLQFGKVKHYF
ncbi:hypothetical protein SCHPADRAFT_626416 [Schizopora paradoxa]|uniref:F-box domain-containing protein n=1 Tax=Schizopora paradoxa TaxID=27342 RepID=A0A0H2R827_9AGAM|nr:hypothetical protein SCHPADRAFT_626416 [Schizopora paradoxa]